MEENVIQINGVTMINVDVSTKNVMYVNKNYVWNPATCSCENGKYIGSIMDDSAIICDKAIDEDADAEAKSNDEAESNNEVKSIDQINFNEKKTTCKTQNFDVLPIFLLITIELLIAVNI